MKWTDIRFLQLPSELWVTGEEAREALKQLLGYHYLPDREDGHIVINRSPVRAVREPIWLDRDVERFLKDCFGERVVFLARSPSRSDAGSEVRRRSENVINVVHEYRVTLKLGDIDALFPPLPGDGPEPWQDTGVQQRLQALGFLYTPLSLPPEEIAPFAEKGWEYYGRVRGKSGRELLATLREEVRNNIVCAGFPAPGQVFAGSDLPSGDDFAAIRIPGAYCINTPKLGYWKTGESWTPAAHSFPIGGRRDDAIKAVWDANPMLGKLPIVALVEKRPIGADPWTPVGEDELEVYFSLVDPDELPTDPTHRLRAPALRGTEMNYGLDLGGLNRWRPDPPRKDGAPMFSPEAWEQGKQLANAIYVRVQQDVAGIVSEAEAARRTLAELERIEREARSPFMALKGRLNNQRLMVKFSSPEGLANLAATKAMKAHDALSERPEEWEAQRLELQQRAEDAGRALDAKMRAMDEEFIRKNDYTRIEEAFEDAKRAREAAERPCRAKIDQAEALDLAAARNEQLSEERRARGDDDVVRAAAYVLDQAAEEQASSDLNQLLGIDMSEPVEIDDRGPRRFVERKMREAAAKLAADDPQRMNAPGEWSGKAGRPVAGSIFSTGSHAGFHDGHGRCGALSVAEAAGAAAPHAVKAKTNTSGYAGVVFMPSHCGGDRYRLRAHVRTGRDAGAREWSAVSGTLVVWQNLRIHKLLRLAPAWGASERLRSLFAEVDALCRDPASGIQHKVGYADRGWEQYFNETGGHDSGVAEPAIAPGDPRETLPPNDPGKLADRRHYRPVEHSFVDLAENLRAGFIELLCDYQAPKPIEGPELERAFANFKTAWATKGEAMVGKKVHWDTLAFVDERSPFLLNVRHHAAYNADLARKRADPATAREFAEYPDLEASDAFAVMKEFAQVHGIQPLAEALMDEGLYPGLTIVQAGHGDTWDLSGFDVAQVFTSGWAGSPRGCFVFYSKKKYQERMCYSASSNVGHELGHVLGLGHQDPNPGGDVYMHEKQASAMTRPAEGETNCLMGYSGCYGEFCGKCVLALRGFRLQKTVWNDPIAQDRPLGVEEDGV